MRKIIILSVLFLFLVSTASAATLCVPSVKYKNIQSAVNAAKSGDRINVAYGTYKENVVIPKKNIQIYGTKYPILHGVSCRAGGNVYLYGLSFNKYGVEIVSSGANTIRNCKFTDNGAMVSGGPKSNINIMNNLFTRSGLEIYGKTNNVTGNTFDGSDTALDIKLDSTCKTVSGNTFRNCNIAVMMENGAAVLNNNVYKNNVYNILYTGER